MVNTITDEIDGNDLDVMLLKSMGSEEERNRAFYISAFDAGWELIASKSLDKITPDDDMVKTCIDRILYSVEEHADRISLLLDDKIKIAYGMIDEKNEEKKRLYTRMLDELLERWRGLTYSREPDIL